MSKEQVKEFIKSVRTKEFKQAKDTLSTIMKDKYEDKKEEAKEGLQ